MFICSYGFVLLIWTGESAIFIEYRTKFKYDSGTPVFDTGTPELGSKNPRHDKINRCYLVPIDFIGEIDPHCRSKIGLNMGWNHFYRTLHNIPL